MFVISQFLLKTSKTCSNINQVSTYSIAIGLILYASIYLYLLFYNDAYLGIFNKFIIYVIIVDLLLSTFYYFNIQDTFKNKSSDSTKVKELETIAEESTDDEESHEENSDDETEEVDGDVETIDEFNGEVDNEDQQVEEVVEDVVEKDVERNDEDVTEGCEPGELLMDDIDKMLLEPVKSRRGRPRKNMEILSVINE